MENVTCILKRKILITCEKMPLTAVNPLICSEKREVTKKHGERRTPLETTFKTEQLQIKRIDSPPLQTKRMSLADEWTHDRNLPTSTSMRMPNWRIRDDVTNHEANKSKLTTSIYISVLKPLLLTFDLEVTPNLQYGKETGTRHGGGRCWTAVQ